MSTSDTGIGNFVDALPATHRHAADQRERYRARHAIGDSLRPRPRDGGCPCRSRAPHATLQAPRHVPDRQNRRPALLPTPRSVHQAPRSHCRSRATRNPCLSSQTESSCQCRFATHLLAGLPSPALLWQETEMARRRRRPGARHHTSRRERSPALTLGVGHRVVVAEVGDASAPSACPKPSAIVFPCSTLPVIHAQRIERATARHRRQSEVAGKRAVRAATTASCSEAESDDRDCPRGIAAPGLSHEW